MMQTSNEIRRRRVRRTLSEVKRKFEEALRLSRRRDELMAAFGGKRSH
jgi:hypothetical protein